VCREQNLVDNGCIHPHAFFVTNFGTTLCLEKDVHVFVSDPNCRGHTIQGFVEKVANFGVLRMTGGDRYVNLVIMTITRQKVTLNECLTNIDVIHKHVMLSDENQHKIKTVPVRYL
jgi:hypothetical protein